MQILLLILQYKNKDYEYLRKSRQNCQSSLRRKRAHVWTILRK
nr:MAG TPA: hypothetical protein [Caudoviricetes sp.]